MKLKQALKKPYTTWGHASQVKPNQTMQNGCLNDINMQCLNDINMQCLLVKKTPVRTSRSKVSVWTIQEAPNGELRLGWRRWDAGKFGFWLKLVVPETWTSHGFGRRNMIRQPSF
eukprot:g51147.t1